MSEVLIVFTGTHISQHLYWIQIFQFARLLFLRLFIPAVEAFYASTRSILCQHKKLFMPPLGTFYARLALPPLEVW